MVTSPPSLRACITDGLRLTALAATFADALIRCPGRRLNHLPGNGWRLIGPDSKRPEEQELWRAFVALASQPDDPEYLNVARLQLPNWGELTRVSRLRVYCVPIYREHWAIRFQVGRKPGAETPD
jgi:hypothetical protein